MGSSLLLPPMALDINSTPPLPSMASDTNSTPARIDHKKPIAFSINEQPRSNKNWLGSFILPNLVSFDKYCQHIKFYLRVCYVYKLF